MIKTSFLLTLLLYVWLGFFAYPAILCGKSTAFWQKSIQWLQPLAISAHGVFLFHFIFGQGPAQLQFGFALALSCMVWLSILIFGLEPQHKTNIGWGAVLFPMAALLFGWPLLYPGNVLEVTNSTLFKFHFACALIAHSLIFVITIEALMVFGVSKYLKNKKSIAEFANPLSNPSLFNRWLNLQAPLWQQESILHRHTWYCFVSLIVAIATGTLYLLDTQNVWIQWNHKFIFSLIGASILGITLMIRYSSQWSVAKFVGLYLSAFVSIALSYIGSHFVLEILLNR